MAPMVRDQACEVRGGGEAQSANGAPIVCSADAAAGVPVVEQEKVDARGLVSSEDLEVGGKYRIPKKKREWWTY
jgi:hypothetical protein